MRSRYQILIGLSICLLLLQACRKDPSIDLWTGPTPMDLPIPSWAVVPGQQPQYPSGPLTVEAVELGRKLFYEKALSNDHSISCATCHRQEHAFSDPRQFSLGTDGSEGRRNSMAIMNALWDGSFFWDGRASSLEDQAFKPVVDLHEMKNTWPVVVDRLQADPEYPDLFQSAFGTSTIDSSLVVKAIAQFERTLLTFNSPFDRYYYGGDSLALTEPEKRGLELFFGEAHCDDCHMPPLFHDHDFRNIGLDHPPPDGGLGEITGDHSDQGRFKTPSIRNIEVTAPYMHDGRFISLEQVVDLYADDVLIDAPGLDQHMLPWVMNEIDLDQQERADLVAFMRTLTDQQFLTDPRFSDPN